MLKRTIAAFMAVLLAVALPVTPASAAADAVSSENGIIVYSTADGNQYSGANIILGSDVNVWPFSTGMSEDGKTMSDVAFTPEKDASYRLTFEVTSRGTSGIRVRWIKDEANGGTSNEKTGYTPGDVAAVNDHVKAAGEVATLIPAYFADTLVAGDTKEFTVEFKMDGSAEEGGLIGNIAIRGQSGNTDFSINKIKIEKIGGETLVNWNKDGVYEEAPVADDKATAVEKPKTSIDDIKPVLPPVPDKGEKPDDSQFVLLYDKPATLYMDKGDWEGVGLALESLQKDIELVGGQKPVLTNDSYALSSMSVIVGTIGKSKTIDKLAADGKIDTSNIKGNWESYIIKVVEKPMAGVDRALVIAGSDKRGTIFGIYKISEMIGVSPWVWWADSVPERSGKLTFDGDLSIEQGEPSVKYRGIFLNDEAPSLSGWVSSKFGEVLNAQATDGYDSEFYSKVFELLLRMKGNYLWPAMWNNAFNTDDPLNPILADKYGIVMGTTHQEHMNCADKEWSWSGLGAWNYFTNRDKIYSFWKDGVNERKSYETVLTLGMRGQADTAILGPTATLGDNMDLLKQVLDDQREIIKGAYGAEDAAPQLLALYKEVEDYYYGSDEFGSLDVPEDVTLLLCDDNFGNVRTLPTEEMRSRSGGFGMYYHFDYRGDPISYQWINQTPLTKVSEQMTMAYDAGVDRIWVVNVGDLKPMELPIDYFLNLAYDIDQWKQPSKAKQFTLEWAEREFGTEFAKDTAYVLDGYTKLNGARKAEIVMSSPSTFSLTSFDEADRVLAEYEAIVAKAEGVYSKLPEYKKASFYQLVLYPARASMNVYKANIYAAWSVYLADAGLPAANEYAVLAQKAFDADAADMEYYNTELSSGKWDGIMRQNHMNYTTWDGPSNGIILNKMPTTGAYEPEAGSQLAIRLQNSDEIVRSGSAELDSFTDLSKENRYIDIFNGKSFPFPFTVSANADWVNLSINNGVCITQNRVGVSVDWTKVTKDSKAIITISGAGTTIKVNVSADVFEASVEEKTFVETHGYVSINPSHYVDKASFNKGTWTVFKNYGRDGDSIKVLPNGKSYEENADAPYVEYSFYIQTAGKYNVNTFIAPTNNLEHETSTAMANQLRFSVQVDGGERLTESGLPADFGAGSSSSWRYGVTDNTRIVSNEDIDLTAGLHTLRVYAVDPGVVIQKIIIAPSSEKQTLLSAAPQTYHFMDSYFGPTESYYVGINKTGLKYPALNDSIKQFKASDVAVTFDTGSGTTRIIAAASNGSKLTAAQIEEIGEPFREGYEFLGWRMPNGAPLSDTIIFTGATTIKAAFISTSAVILSYDANGGTGTTDAESFAIGETAVVAANRFSNSGKVFSHWNTKNDDSGDVYAPGTSLQAHEDINLYAIWASSAPKLLTSSELADGRAANAFDGNDNTLWKLQGTVNEWIEFELTNTYNIDGIYVVENGNNIGDYELQYWNGENWETGLIGNGIGANGDLLFTAAKVVNTNKLRLNIISASNPPSIKEITVTPFTNWALESNGGSVISVPEGGEGTPEAIIDGDRIDYVKRWRINSQEGFKDPITIMLADTKNISVVNVMSITGLWNTTKDLRHDTEASTALGTLFSISIEYTADGTTWLPLPGGSIEENPYSWISVKLDSPVEMKGLRFIVPDQSNSDYSDSWIRVVEVEALELTDPSGVVAK